MENNCLIIPVGVSLQYHVINIISHRNCSISIFGVYVYLAMSSPTVLSHRPLPPSSPTVLSHRPLPPSSPTVLSHRPLPPSSRTVLSHRPLPPSTPTVLSRRPLPPSSHVVLSHCCPSHCHHVPSVSTSFPPLAKPTSHSSLF